ncbi:hypothetical protein LCGC14_1796470, partial [marine sediment metagenome]
QTAYSLDDTINPAASPANTFYVCTTAGTSGSSEPDPWPDFTGAPTVNDETVVWTATERNQYSARAPLWVVDQTFHSSRGNLSVTLILQGIFDLMDKDFAESIYTQEAGDANTVKDLLTAVAQATLAPFTNAKAYTITFDTEDNLLDTAKPGQDFEVIEGETRLDKIKDLLAYTKCVARIEADGAIHILSPVTDGETWAVDTLYYVNDYVQPTSPNNNFAYRCTASAGDNKSHAATEPTWPTTAGGTVVDDQITWTAVDFHYEYKVNVSGEHELLAKSHQKPLIMPNHITYKNHPDDDDAFSGTAEFTDSSDITDQEHRLTVFIKDLESDAVGLAYARAHIQRLRHQFQSGSAEVPINLGQETHDYIKLTDSRESDLRIGNVGHTKATVGRGIWRMLLALGDIRLGGFLGLLPAQEEAAIRDFLKQSNEDLLRETRRVNDEMRITAELQEAAQAAQVRKAERALRRFRAGQTLTREELSLLRTPLTPAGKELFRVQREAEEANEALDAPLG